ncbi:stage III sporulation protein AA [uncultured Clostridium sp.]|jgi:stage III sporulation protein AA|uniref:stage III sporulation protein AA n=1 Tax=uncultured Clostridium sp. TaxID=59620 RepID=UPI00261CF7FD|nr:stage III sporulation protein AA [uncultured Clostridium sp.]
MDKILRLLPKGISNSVMELKEKASIEEIRLSIGKKLRIIVKGQEVVKPYVVTNEDIKIIIQKISNYSLYAVEEEIRQGYITIEGGHRVGLAGQCIIQNNTIKTIKHISSLNIRVAREIIGCSDKIMKYIISGKNIKNTLIISPPRCGKTTLLRDISRNISNGYKPLALNGKRVVIIDERSEIASCYRGVAQMDVGERTDIYDNCLKGEGLMMAIRTMSPDVIICDEIGSSKDIEGIIMAYNSGVNVICTLHGNNIEDLYKRDIFRDILNQKLIEKVILLSARDGAGHIEEVYDV